MNIMNVIDWTAIIGLGIMMFGIAIPSIAIFWAAIFDDKEHRPF